MHCKDGRSLEISASISVAPGRLGQYTKIARFSPRYVLVNQLGRPVRLWQDSSLIHSNFASTDSSRFTDGKNTESASKWRQTKRGNNDSTTEEYELLFGDFVTVDHRQGTGMEPGTTAHRSALYIATGGPSELVPFHLPDTRADRQLRIDFGMGWNLTSSWPADIAGDYTLQVTRAVDLRLLSHVTTRAAPQYKIILPPQDANDQGSELWDGELGMWFETDWVGGRKIVVKGTKRVSHSSTCFLNVYKLHFASSKIPLTFCFRFFIRANLLTTILMFMWEMSLFV